MVCVQQCTITQKYAHGMCSIVRVLLCRAIERTQLQAAESFMSASEGTSAIAALCLIFVSQTLCVGAEHWPQVQPLPVPACLDG